MTMECEARYAQNGGGLPRERENPPIMMVERAPGGASANDFEATRWGGPSGPRGRK